MAGRIEVGGVRPAEQMQTELRKSQRELNRVSAEIDAKRLKRSRFHPRSGENADDLRRNISENSQMLRRLREELADLPRTAKMRRSAMERDQQKLESEAAALDPNFGPSCLRARSPNSNGPATAIVWTRRTSSPDRQRTRRRHRERPSLLADDEHPTEDPGGAGSFPTTSTQADELEMDNPIERVKVS